jgi:hypothetical protein
VFFAPRDDAYKEKRTFSIHVNYNALRYSALISRGIATDDEESRKFWSDQIVTFFILQENIVCPDFNVTFPRINVVARVYVDGAPISWGLLVCVCVCVWLVYNENIL